MVDIGIVGGCRPCSMRLDLDPVRPNENTILRYIATGRFYEPDVAQVLLHVLREGDTFIDVGANVGFFTMLAAALVGPTGKVLCFEPDPNSDVRLRHNIEINGFDHVTVVNRPALAAATPVEFYLNSDDSGGSAAWDVGQLAANVRSRETPKILSLTSTTLDKEVANLGSARVRLIKIDTEGADHAVLQGAAETLRADGGVPFVVCELHEYGLAKMGSNQAALREAMAALGYDCFALSYDGRLPHHVPKQTRIHQRFIGNLLFSNCEAVSGCWPDYIYEPGVL